MYFAAGSVLPNSPLEIIYFHYSALFFQYFCEFSVSRSIVAISSVCCRLGGNFFIVNFTYFHIPNT